MTSLYIHIPFCQNKCFYCSFVVSIGQEQRVDAYLDSLALEARPFLGTKIETAYIGGGTPTFLNSQQLKKLISIIRTNFQFSDHAEFTIEANPEGIDPAKANLLFDLGINRVSSGVQSLNDKYLKDLGRCHDAETARKAFYYLRAAGFDNINLDLMYSFPGQTEKEIANDVRAIADLGSDHLSLYTLTIEKNSRFFVRQIRSQDDHVQADQYVLVTRLLESAGFRQYEISNFAKPGKESRHNLNYWTGGNYIGLGIGAHSHRDGTRSWNIPKLIDYIEKTNQGERVQEDREDLDTLKRFLETLLLGLRMNQGVDLTGLEKKYSCKLTDEKEYLIDEFVKNGFFIREGARLRASDYGRLVLDELAARLI